MQDDDPAGGDNLNADVEEELFGGMSDEDETAAQQQEERGPPINVEAPLLPRYEHCWLCCSRCTSGLGVERQHSSRSEGYLQT